MYRREDLHFSLFPPTSLSTVRAAKSSAVPRNNHSPLRASRNPPQRPPPSLYGTLTGRHGAKGLLFLERLNEPDILQAHRTNSQKRQSAQWGQNTSLLPGINMKCTSMIIDSVNCNINYSSPYFSNLYQSSRASIVSGRTVGLKSTPFYTSTFSSGIQATESRFEEAQKTLHISSKVSNVRVTMQYLGTGGPEKNELVTPKDELRMFQQICGGENLCVYRGYLCPGEHFQFLSKRHPPFPFSASIYINGIIYARISTCCEYKYHVGFQQGRRGCFRVSGLSGGKPCYRCIKVHNQKHYRKKHERQHLERPPADCLPKETNAKEEAEGYPSILQDLEYEKTGHLPATESRLKSEDINNPASQDGKQVVETSSNGRKGDEKKHKLNEILPNENGGQVSRTNVRKRLKKKRIPREASDSEQENYLSKKDRSFRRSTHRTKARMTDHERNSKSISPGKSYLETGSAETAGYDSASRVQSPDLSSANSGDVYNEDPVHRKAHTMPGRSAKNKVLPGSRSDTNRDASTLKTRPIHMESSCEWSVQEKLATAFTRTDDFRSDVELSESSDTSDVRGTGMPTPRGDVQLGVISDPKSRLEDVQLVHEEKAESDGAALQNQIAEILAVLRECDEVDQLVLRNTGMTGDLLELLTKALIESQSDIETINLNLNNLGPTSARDLVLLLKAKPSLKRLLLFGNQMGDEGITALINGLSELLTKVTLQDAQSTTEASPELNLQKSLNLIELDIGGNKLTSKGLWSVASFLRMNPPIQYLGLAQNNIESLESWVEFFDSMKVNTNITHMLLDENNLGNEGAKLLADMLKVNQSLCKIDLDSNNIGEDGAAAIIESLKDTTHSFLVHVSLDENQISPETRDKINELLTQNF